MAGEGFGGFDLGDMLEGVLGNVPQLLRPQLEAWLKSNGILWGREFSRDTFSASGGEWAVCSWALQTEPQTLFVSCRWLNGNIPETIESVFCRSVILTGAIDAELARVIGSFKRRIEDAP
jgi:hypothetical protein